MWFDYMLREHARVLGVLVLFASVVAGKFLVWDDYVACASGASKQMIVSWEMCLALGGLVGAGLYLTVFGAPLRKLSTVESAVMGTMAVVSLVGGLIFYGYLRTKLEEMGFRFDHP